MSTWFCNPDPRGMSVFITKTTEQLIIIDYLVVFFNRRIQFTWKTVWYRCEVRVTLLYNWYQIILALEGARTPSRTSENCQLSSPLQSPGCDCYTPG